MRLTYLLALTVALAAVCPAQMGHGMMGGAPSGGSTIGGGMTHGSPGSGMPGGSTAGSMMPGSLGGMTGGSMTGLMSHASGLTIGADGSVYLVRSAPPQTQKPGTQLVAVDVNGLAKWTVALTASSVSQPALGNDGTLFVTTSDWLSWMSNGLATTAGANLVVVKPDSPASASILATVPLQGQIASAPQVGPDNAGGYVVYVLTVDGFTGNSVNSSSTSGTYLHAFLPTGTLKYRIQLTQGTVGLTTF